MSMTDILGMALIIVCIVLISLTKSETKTAEKASVVVLEDENIGLYKVLTIVFAFGCGIIFTINTIDNDRVLKLGFTSW